MDRLCIVMIRTYRPWYWLWLLERKELNVLSPPTYFQPDTVHAQAQKIRATVSDEWSVSVKNLSDVKVEYGLS